MKSKKNKVRAFSLLGSFSSLSLVSLLLVSSVTAYLLSDFLRESLLQRDAQVTRQFIQSVAEQQNTTAYFLTKDFGESKLPLDNFFKSISEMENVIRANVYSRDGTIIWSSDGQMTGMRFPDNHEFRISLAGGTVYEYREFSRDSHDKAEHILFEPGIHDIVENYIPIYSNTVRDVVGVVEIYRQPVELIKTINQGVRLVWSALLMAGALLFITLFWIVRRAQQVMTAQEIALANSEKLRAVGEMASVVAHGIRNPIASIRSSAELAADELQGLAKDHMVDVISKVDRIESWVKELLLFWTQSGNLVNEAQVPQVIDASVSDFAHRATIQQSTIYVDLHSHLPTAKCDPKLLQYVFNTLISKAMETMPEGGVLHIDSVADSDQLRITFRDIGIDTDKKNADSTGEPNLSHHSNGLGIGLELAKQILIRFGGWLEYDNHEGHGTRATVVLLQVEK